MPADSLRRRIVEQFSYRGDRADVWRAFDRFLDTDAYLNLGYSPRYLPPAVGSSQRRLAAVVGEGLAARLGHTAGRRLLDVGCGRGGPSIVLATEHGFAVTGVDLVRYNVAAARRNARGADGDAAFVVGDASSLPVRPGSMAAVTAVDALVYVPDGREVFEGIARALRPGGVLAVTDLVAADAGADLDAFADAWDMPAIVPRDAYLAALDDAGFDVDGVRDLSSHSVDRFRAWTRWYLRLADRWSGLVDRALARWDLDAARVTAQVRAAHQALPHLEHVLVYARAE